MKLLATVFVLLLSYSVHSQDLLSKDRNMFRHGDRVVKKEVVYKDLNHSISEGVWDISDIDESGKGYSVKYKESESESSTVVESHHSTRYYYSMDSDTLFLKGYENNDTKINYDLPMPYLRFPLNEGDKISGYYHGRGVYDDKMAIRCFGYCETSVEGVGRMYLPSGDTLCNVVHTHSIQLAGQRIYRTPHTDGQIRTYLEKLKTIDIDSIKYLLSTDSSIVEIQTHRWYAMGYRYPVFETITTSLYGDAVGTPLYTAAYYYPPEKQYYLDSDADNEPILQATDYGRKELLSRQAARDLSIVNAHSVSIEQGKNDKNVISVEYTLKEPSFTFCKIITTDGAEVFQSPLSERGLGNFLDIIPTDGFQPGVYVIIFYIGNETYTKKITI